MSVRLVRPQSLPEPSERQPEGQGPDIPELAPGRLDRLVAQLTTAVLQLPAAESSEFIPSGFSVTEGTTKHLRNEGQIR